MKSSKKATAVFIGIVAIVILLLMLHKSSRTGTPQSLSSNQSEASTPVPQQIHSVNGVAPPTSLASIVQGKQQSKTNQSMSQAELAIWQGPLTYFGKVIDESNQPISGVKIYYGANSMNESQQEVYNTGMVTTDERGIFKIDGVNGVNLMVQLSHPNYYPFPDNSTGFDKRSLPQKGYFSDTEERAEIFRMHSKGHPVPLVHRRGGADVPVNGASAKVDFYGEQDKQVVGSLQIEASGDTPKNYNPMPYDWAVRLTIPNGGLIEYTNQFDFVAPDSGYQQTIEIDMPKDQAGWSDTVNKSFFVKLPDGYLRMGIHMRAKTPLYTSLEYFYNPDGSKNLESQ